MISKKAFIFVVSLLALSLFLAGCAQQKCPDCVCPEAKCPEQKCPDVDLTKCPTIIKEKEVKITRYVCSDGRVEDSMEACTAKHVTPSMYAPIKTNEKGTVIQSFTVEAGCFGANAAVVRFKVGTVPDSIIFQLKESPNEDFKNIITIGGVYDGTKYLVICTNCRDGDYQLKPGKAYLLRTKFNQSVYGRIEYSNEHVIDTTSGSEYMVKKCAG